MAEKNSFKFSQWAKALPAAAVDTLVEAGYDSWLALANVSREEIDSLPLKPGHRTAAVALITDLQVASDGPLTKSATATTTEGGSQALHACGEPGASTLDELLQRRAATEQPSLGGRIDLEPTVFLGGQGKGETLQIKDFIPFSTNDDESNEIEMAEGIIIRLPGRKRTKLDSISPAQYLTANARIMAKLITNGHLAGQGILDYLAYTAKVGEMATRFTWSSVLLYDHQYRQSQAAYGFRWGADSQHLATVALRERQTPTAAQRTKQQAPQQRHPRRTVGPSGREVCLQWNQRGHCSFGPQCRYEHCCSICFQTTHPASAHPSTPGAGSGP